MKPPKFRGDYRLVAKLAWYASAAVTLGHYTQAVRGGEVAAEALDRAYRVA